MKAPIILLLVSLIIISIWFKDGKFLATGEEGLILANPTRAIEIYKYSWNEIGSGGAIPGVNPMIPFLYFESQVINIGMPIWLFQAIIFFLLMFIGSCSIYYLSLELFGKLVKEKILLGLIAALFFMLNPISMLGVWYRFLLAFMFFYTLAPLFFYLYIYGINNKKKIFIILAPLISLIFSFAFTGPAFILLVWLLPFLYSLSLSLVGFFKEKQNLNIFPLVYFALSFGFWIIINLWWIFPYIELSKFAFAAETDLAHAVGTLKANSADFTIDNVVRLIHGGFLYRNEAFGSIYKTPFFILFSWFVPIITIYGLLKIKSGHVKIFFTLSLLILLFLAKGTSSPFGEIYLWFFSHVSFLQVYRNSLEKIGMLLPIIYAPLFSFGLLYLLARIRSFQYKAILLSLVVVCSIINNWPFFTGAMVYFKDRDIRTEIPSSFINADKSIPDGEHIIFSIPNMGGASGLYKWNYGYAGIEGSEYLFSYPVITKFYDTKSSLGQLLIGVSHGKFDNNLIGIAQLFSADVIAFRKDTNLLAFGYNLDAFERSEKMITHSNLTKIYDSKEVSMWLLPKDKVIPVISTPHSIKFGDSPQELISLIANDQFDPSKNGFICNNNQQCRPHTQILDLSAIQKIDPPERIDYKKISPVSYEISVNNSKGRFLLVFSQSYHPGWSAYVDGKSLSSDKHIVANGYANAFIIDDQGSFNINLHFVPEEQISKSYQISIFAILLGGITLLLSGLLSVFRDVKSVKK